MMLHNKERIHSCKEKKNKFYLQTMKVSHNGKRKKISDPLLPKLHVTIASCIKLLGKIISFDNLTNQLGNLLRCCNHKEEVNVCSATNM